MNHSTSEKSDKNWRYYDFISSYRFWALVAAAFLHAITNALLSSTAVMAVQLIGGDSTLIGSIYAFALYGVYFGVIAAVFLARIQLKRVLIAMALISAIGAFAFLSIDSPSLFPLTLSMILLRFGEAGFMLTAAAAIVAGRSDVQSFAIAFAVMFLWTRVAGIVAPILIVPTLDIGMPALAAALPAVLAALLLATVSPKLFSEPPSVSAAPSVVRTRNPWIVFLLCTFIPFYVFYWLYKRAGELRAIAPDAPTPTGTGAVIMGLFAPFVFPLWMYDARAKLKTRQGHDGKLAKRSPLLIGAVSLIFPTIGAALAQSDSNAFANKQA